MIHQNAEQLTQQLAIHLDDFQRTLQASLQLNFSNVAVDMNNRSRVQTEQFLRQMQERQSYRLESYLKKEISAACGGVFYIHHYPKFSIDRLGKDLSLTLKMM